MIGRVRACLRSGLHLTWMGITVMPYAVLILGLAAAGVRGERLYGWAVAWLRWVIVAADRILGVRYRITGQQHLTTATAGQTPTILLVKHQSTYETFLLPVIMPRPLAFVFKKELLQVPFFGWAMGCLDMIHIDRSQGARAFQKMLTQGRELLDRGIWVIMFPEGTRTARFKRGTYNLGGAMLALRTGAQVIPIAVTSARCWPPKAWVKRPGVVDVSIGAPISSVGCNPKELMRQVEDWIEAEMRRLDPLVYAAD